MTIEHEELSTLVPHRGKMFIIDRITDAKADEWIIESETKITEDFMFYDKNAGGVPNYACFEIIAQTVAALTGLYARENNLPPNIGFILSVTNLHFDFDLIKPGEIVKVKAFRDAVVENMHSFRADVYLKEKPAGGGKLTVMEAKEA